MKAVFAFTKALGLEPHHHRFCVISRTLSRESSVYFTDSVTYLMCTYFSGSAKLNTNSGSVSHLKKKKKKNV